jgi:hypothetical protein
MFGLQYTRNPRVDGHVLAQGMPDGSRVVAFACGSAASAPHADLSSLRDALLGTGSSFRRPVPSSALGPVIHVETVVGPSAEEHGEMRRGQRRFDCPEISVVAKKRLCRSGRVASGTAPQRPALDS